MPPTETLAPTTTRAPETTVPRRRLEPGRGLVTMARLEPAGGGLTIAVTAASMVMDSKFCAVRKYGVKRENTSHIASNTIARKPAGCSEASR